MGSQLSLLGDDVANNLPVIEDDRTHPIIEQASGVMNAVSTKYDFMGVRRVGSGRGAAREGPLGGPQDEGPGSRTW